MSAPGYAAANLDVMRFAPKYQASIVNLVAKKLNLSSHGEGILLDFGAGQGDYVRQLKAHTGLKILSYEPDKQLHRHHSDTDDVTAYLDAISDQSVTAAYSLNVFEHIPDDVAALKNLARKCKKDALIFVLVPANQKLWTPMDDQVGHVRRYSPEMLRTLAHTAQLTVLEQGWFDRTGYIATRGYQALGRMRAAAASGVLTPEQVKTFDRIFGSLEPMLAATNCNFGKNCWALLLNTAR